MLIHELEKKIKYKFNDTSLIKEALTHSSHNLKKNKSYKRNYERLEFLGDRVLGLVLAEYLFKVLTNANEGFLNNYYQKYVSQEYLAKYSKKIELSNYIRTQKGDNLNNNKSILSDVIESIIGAIYIDSGLTECKNFIINEIIDEAFVSSKPDKHPKSVLQEYCLNKFKSLPKYKVIDKSGNDHTPVYTVSVNIQNFETVSAKGSNLKSAEQAAALKILNIIKTKLKK